MEIGSVGDCEKDDRRLMIKNDEQMAYYIESIQEKGLAKRQLAEGKLETSRSAG